MRIFTIGHSNHSIEAFIALLKRHQITAIADVRSQPFSRRFPQFNQALLKDSLKAESISYVFLGKELGARSSDPACYVDGQARYERIAQTEEFLEGIDRIRNGAQHHTIALMCAEQDPITCHRSILVCYHLRNVGLEIVHILKNGELEFHQQLEQRLLHLHRLTPTLSKSILGAIPNSQEQLQLFDLHSFDAEQLNHQNSPAAKLSEEDLIQQAYQLQGDRIAYTKPHSGEESHGQAS